jgi:hypothetical protein
VNLSRHENTGLKIVNKKSSGKELFFMLELFVLSGRNLHRIKRINAENRVRRIVDHLLGIRPNK